MTLKELALKSAEALQALEAVKEEIWGRKRAAERKIDAEYRERLDFAQAEYAKRDKAYTTQMHAELVADALERLPFPEGTVLEEWSHVRKGAWKWEECKPYRTGRVGTLRLIRNGDDLRGVDGFRLHVGLSGVVLHTKSGKPGKQVVAFQSSWKTTERWIERGKGWADWQPLKPAARVEVEDDDEQG